MEKCIRKIIVIVFFILSSKVFCQTSQFDKKIRFNVWADLDAYPEMEYSPDLKQFDYPIRQIRKIVPFFMSGLVYGWTFTYVPYDKARGVEEYFEIEEIKAFDIQSEDVNFTGAKIQDGRFSVWCEYTRNNYQREYYNSWAAIKNPVIHGKGCGKVSKGFEGYTDGAKEAVKNGVREYYRKIVKNKPKEISGKILIKDEPLAGVQDGQYVINLDFFMECDKIVSYTAY